MFTNSISPALQAHLDAQLNFVTELSRKMFDTALRLNELNMRLAQELLEEAATANQRILTARGGSEAMSLAASHLQPGSDKLRQYQQKLSHLMADANVEMNRTAEAHLPEASRTAVAFADELVRKTAEETEKATRRQREMIANMHVGAHSDGTGRQPEAAGRQDQAH
ncbi:phasin family protein [Janthinobacterium sp. J1-1]|uniref:phasin family protein n=1 Tax=unclassified Janthinobacterium TaxID=2610881 RepID=UPI0028128A6A|nr:phasin family protein [Janthinobacterium sp. J1-1]